MRTKFTLLAVLATGAFSAYAGAQDSVSKLNALPGDAVDAHTAAEQINDFVVDQAALTSTWGNAFGVAPLIKASAERVLNPDFYTGQLSAQGISRLTRTNVPFARSSYALWNGQGFGINNNPAKNNPPASINTSSSRGFQFGCAFSEFSTGTTNPIGLNADLGSVTGGVVNFEGGLPSRLYVSRVCAAVNGSSQGCNVSSFGFGAVDEDGIVSFRADSFNAVDCAGDIALTGDNLYRVLMLSRMPGVLNIIRNNPAGPSDAGATVWMAPMNMTPSTINTPNIIPSGGGGPKLIGTNFGIQYLYENPTGTLNMDPAAAHLAAGVVDQRGNIAYSAQNFTSLFGAASTAGTAAILSKGSGPQTDTLDMFGIDVTGQFVGPLARVLPAVISECDAANPWSNTNVPGTQQFDHYHGSVAFRGGNGQVALGKDQAGNLIAAATVYYGGVSNTDKNNYIAVARTTPAGVTTWGVAGWTQETTVPVVSNGKTIYQNGTMAIGRLTGALFGPAIGAPMIDSVGNIWFLSAIRLNGPPVTSAVGLVRAVYDQTNFCYKLELILKEGDVLPGRNSATNYRIGFLNIAGGTTVSPGTAWSSNISAATFENLKPCSGWNTSDPQTLGGLVLSAGITYDNNGDGQFIRSTGPNGVPGSPDEDYNVLLYVSASKDCNHNGIPDDADVFNGTSMDVNGNVVPDECEVVGPGTAFCFPGQGGIIPCPCSNPGYATHGCENSATTGGAFLLAAGVPSLTTDTLSFVCTGEKPTAFSILLQAQNPISLTGIKFGQGLRCVTAQLKRLYTHAAVCGAVTYPQGADLPIHNQSAAKGDTITPGTRHYLSYYRDPTVLGGCGIGDTFNASQGVSIVWAP